MTIKDKLIEKLKEFNMYLMTEEGNNSDTERFIQEISKIESKLKESDKEHDSCDGCKFMQDCRCMLDDSCPPCIFYCQWTPKEPDKKPIFRCSNCGKYLSDCDMSCYYKDNKPLLSAEEIFNKYCILVNKDSSAYIIRDKNGFINDIKNASQVENEENPYLLSGDELNRTENERKNGIK